ncbi:SemiSWEET family transporter [Fluviispira multicolorata]|uniref:Sugar efflux transporter for intercellular exchange n=1 Tax=Fluviispira multicolorata TaxID=2654512 RepID=A0A833JCK6_9BACT|nr:SemiSWEET family transporter [Fluviispira multicolorata]KAB8029860.1 hypothetical protein GCL57_09995 [Fluviispira multicolorata]
MVRNKLFENYMSCIGPIGNSMFYFQAYEIFSSKNSGSVSLIGFSISIIALNSWLFYGVYIKNKPLIFANIVGALGAFFVVLGIIIYPKI